MLGREATKERRSESGNAAGGGEGGRGRACVAAAGPRAPAQRDGGSPSAYRRIALWVPLLTLVVALSSCGRVERERMAAAEAAREETRREMEDLLAERIEVIGGVAEFADRVLSPLPVMRPGEEAVLRRYLNASHVARARELGVRAEDDEAVDSLVAAGRLVELEDSTGYWIVRPGTSPAYVVPDLPALLEMLGERFQDRLADLGLPPYRMEITSALRTAEGQARLRRSNANAAAGVSSHEYGTTVDLSYAAFAPPAQLPKEIMDGVPDGLRFPIRRMADLALESVSARKSRELGRIFSQVLAEAQGEGMVLVIYERQQTVYHVTAGRAME